MDVARREKLLTTRFEPTVAGVGLTLRAVPVTAAVVRDGRMVAAVGALIEMPAQGGGATAHDGSQHFDVLPGDPPAAAFDESASCGANQIGHLERRPVHLIALRYLVFQLERVQRTRGGVEVSLGEMEIDRRLFQITMAQQHLNSAQIRTRLQQMSCEAVAQGMRMDFLVDPRPLGSLLAGIPHYLGGDGMIGGVPAAAWE